MIRAYKMFRVKDNKLYSLYVDRGVERKKGEWLRAEYGLEGKGLAYRPGWHAASTPSLPHLSRKGRAVKEVWLTGEVTVHNRPKCQGGKWYTAEYIYVGRVRNTLHGG